jgi:hypothetical protein
MLLVCGCVSAFQSACLTLAGTIDPYEWTTRKRTGKPRDLDHLPGPRSVSFGGQVSLCRLLPMWVILTHGFLSSHSVRYRADTSLQYFSWMGWGMYLGFDRDMGLSLWDVRFRGERIVYQLAPQDALAQYGAFFFFHDVSSNDPILTCPPFCSRCRPDAIHHRLARPLLWHGCRRSRARPFV